MAMFNYAQVKFFRKRITKSIDMKIKTQFLVHPVLLLLLVMLLGINQNAWGQSNNANNEIANTDTVQQDLRDFIRGSKPPKKAPRQSMILVLPNVSSNPANGLLFGVAGSTGFYLGSKSVTRVSSIGFNAAYTTKNQLVTFAKSNIYLNKDKFFLQGDLRYFIYNAPTWGLGTNSPVSSNTETALKSSGDDSFNIDDGYKLGYRYLKFHEIVNLEVGKFKYIGMGYHLDYYSKIEDYSLNLSEEHQQLTPHYLYSTQYGFETSEYGLSGLSLNGVYDSRDNMINPYHGYYFHVNYRYNPKFLGSDQNSSVLWTEFRTFVPLSKAVQRHVLAFWLFGSFQVSGHLPYLTLMALGEDQRARSGRGYIAGRFRGEDLIYGEIEYRFPISPKTKILGGVLFVNATSSSNRSQNVGLFDYVRPGGGIGLRIMLNKNFRTNINLDLALGKDSKGLYFSGTETF
jgi:hypothetical protein